MEDYIAYVAKDLSNHRGMFCSAHRDFLASLCEVMMKRLLWRNRPSFSVPQPVTSWSVLRAGPARSSAASVKPSRLVSANCSATVRHSSPPIPGCSSGVTQHTKRHCTLATILHLWSPGKLNINNVSMCSSVYSRCAFWTVWTLYNFLNAGQHWECVRNGAQTRR